MREQDLAAASLSSNAIMPCLSLSSNNASALMDVYQSYSLGNGMPGYHATSTASSSHIRSGDVNNIAPLATPLFQLPTPAITSNFSDKVANVFRVSS